MPYTAAQLAQFYNNLTFGNPPSAATTAVFNNASSQDAAGTITDAQAFQAVNGLIGVRSTLDVAVASYALFTGATPTQAGINYLINNPGTGFNTSYYNGVGGTAAAPAAGGFDAENRYFNAAINLAATTGSAGNAAFVSTYGGLSLAQTISTAYNQIIGTAAVGASAASAAITSITSSLPYFQALAAQRVVSGNSVDIATKAIIVGYILEEGIKADVGIYAKALDGFNFALATGNGVFNTNLLTTFGANGTNFNSQVQPLADGQTITGGATVNSIGVAANGTGTINVASNSTINLTGDIAVNNGQLAVNVANAATSGSDVLNFNITGQSVATAASFIAPGVETINLTAQTNGAAVAVGTVLSVDIQDPTLTTLNIRGSESVVYSAPLYAFLDGTFSTGALTTINASGAAVPVTLDVSSMTATANGTSGGGVTVTGTTGADTFMVRNFATVTGGGGNDTFMVSAPGSISSVSVVTDDHAGVVVGFAGLRATSFRSAAITATSVQNGLDQAAAFGPGVVSYFQSGGDTYVVGDASTASTFQAGTDFVIRLVGAHNLSSSTLTAQGAVTLGG